MPTQRSPSLLDPTLFGTPQLGDLPASTLYHYLHADGTLKDPARRLLDA